MLIYGMLALCITLAAAPLTLAVVRRRQILDVPNGRSSHVHPTPRGGGVAPALGMIVAVALAPQLTGSFRVALLLAICGFAALGLTDDIVKLEAMPRLVVQAVIAACTVPWLLTDMSGSAAWQLLLGVGVLLWLVSYVNAFNFMDGINGISATQAVMAGGVWFAIGQTENIPVLAVGGAIIAGASLGFAPFNFPKARMFLGDVGSYAFGGAVAVVAVMGLRLGLPPEAVLAPLAVYVADTAVTLVRRIHQGEPWSVAHRDHTYQQFVRSGWSHAAATGVVAAVIAVCAGLGAVSLSGSLGARVAADTALLAVLAAYVMVPARVLARARRSLVVTAAHAAEG